MTLYQIQAQAVHTRGDGSQVSMQLPTFLLSADIQGILSEDHAQSIALDILSRSANHSESTQFEMTVWRVS